MSDPVVVDIAQGEWVIVATAVTCGIINQKAFGYSYYQTYRDTGGAAPDAIVATKLPEEAVPMFQKDFQEIIASSVGIDIYVCCWNWDNHITADGKVRVDI